MASFSDGKSRRQEQVMQDIIGRALASFAVDPNCPGAEVIERYVWDDENEGRAALDGHIAACVACAAEVEGLVRLKREQPSAPGRARPVGPTSELLAALRRLLDLVPPVFVPAVARGASGSGRGEFAAAMRDYAAGRFPAAADKLAAARRAGHRLPELAYYLGVTLLVEGRFADAAQALADAVKARPKVGEYRWQLAQALLAQGRFDEALKQLKRVSSLTGPFGHRATELAAQVRELLRTHAAE